MGNADKKRLHTVQLMLDGLYQNVTTLTPSGTVTTGHVCRHLFVRRGYDLDLDVPFTY